MSKIQGWTKFDEYAWHTSSPVFGAEGTLYKFIWVTSKNTIRIVDGAPLVYNRMAKMKAVVYPISQSYEYARYRTLRDAANGAYKLMKENPPRENINPESKYRYEAIYDDGKPWSVFYSSDSGLKKGLKQFYLDHKDDDSYFDVQVYNNKGDEITESQLVQEMIAEIIGE